MPRMSACRWSAASMVTSTRYLPYLYRHCPSRRRPQDCLGLSVVESSPDAERAPYDPMPHGPAEVGVGPWVGPWPAGEQYDERLLAEGDRRNVVDRYRYWTMEAIVANLDTRRHDFHVA